MLRMPDLTVSMSLINQGAGRSKAPQIPFVSLPKTPTKGVRGMCVTQSKPFHLIQRFSPQRGI